MTWRLGYVDTCLFFILCRWEAVWSNLFGYELYTNLLDVGQHYARMCETKVAGVVQSFSLGALVEKSKMHLIKWNDVTLLVLG